MTQENQNDLTAARQELKNLLTTARHEIVNLRKRNEIMSAQLAIVDVFAAVMGLKRGDGVMTIDIAWELERAINKLGENND